MKKTSFSIATTSDSVPDSSSRLAIAVHSTLIDRWAGLSQTYEIWGSTPNKQYVTDGLADAFVRQQLAQFFVGRQFGSVFTKIIPMKSMRPNETALTKKDIFDGLSNLGLSTWAHGVAVELTLPLLMKLGIVSPNIKYSVHRRYGFSDVTLMDVRTNIATFQVLQATESVQGTNINSTTKYSTNVLAELLAEAFRPIGLALLEVDSLNSVVDDLVKGVRAHIDPLLVDGKSFEGSIPNDWRNHKVVAELATNYVFVKEALSLPSGSKISLQNEGFNLERWSPLILAAVKSSERYAWVGKAEYLRNYSLSKVRQLDNTPVASVIFQAAKVQPIAQSVIAIADEMVSSAYNVSPTKDRISDAVQSAYGNSDFSMADGAALVHGVLTDSVESGWTGNDALYAFNIDPNFDPQLFAVMISNRLWVRADNMGVAESVTVEKKGAEGEEPEIITTWVPRWWYAVDTRERSVKVVNGVHLQSEVFTSDPVEAILAADEFEAADVIQPRPQVLGASAFNSRIVGFDVDNLRALRDRFSFDVSVAGVQMRGSLRAADFASMRTTFNTALVIPHFNESVISGLQETYVAAEEIIKKMSSATAMAEWRDGVVPDAQFSAFASRRVARAVLRLSQMLSPAFRKDVHDAIVERTILVSGLTTEQSTLLRARLHQKTFAACSDVIALRFFLFLQGIKGDAWDSILKSEELYRACMEVGSDRV